MAGTDPLSWLVAPAVLQGLRRALGWAAEQAAEALVEEGAKATARGIAARLRGDEAQAQFQAAWEQAVAALRREERFREVADPLLQNGSLILEEAAKVAAFGAEPDLDQVLRWSLGLPPEKRELAREALEFLFARLREALYDQPAYQEIWELWEARLTRAGVEKLAGELSLARGHLADLARAALDARRGLYVRPAAPLPDPLQVKLYLEEMAARRPRSLFGEEVAYAPLEVKPEELSRRIVAGYFRAEGMPPFAWAEVRGEPLERVMARELRLVLLGDPGAGKTTALQHLAQQEAERALAGEGGIPIYVELKTYRGEAELEALLAKAVDDVLWARGLRLSADEAERVRMTRGWLETEGPRFLLLFDGLNEVPPEHRPLAEERLVALLRGPCRALVTCRERDYAGALTGTPAYVLQGLWETEVRAFLVRFFEQHTGDLRAGARLYEEQIKRDMHLRDLAANPLMLRLLAQVALLSPQRALPRNKGQLFRDVAQTLPELRRRERVTLPPPAWPDVEGGLRALGLAMQEAGRLQFTLEEARKRTGYGEGIDRLLTAAKFYRFLKSDGLAGEPVEFLHHLFQEYFAADELRARLERQGDYAAVLGDRPFTGEWDEVVVMLAGIYDRPEELVRWLGQEVVARQQGRAALLVRRCWETSDASSDAEARAAVVDALIQALRDPDSRVSWEAAGALVRIGVPAVKSLTQALRDSNDMVRWRATGALGGIGDPRTVEPLIRALRAPNVLVRREAAGALGRIGDVQAVEPLIQVLSDPRDAVVRRTAAEALGRIGDARAVEPLIWALRDPDERVCIEAVRALGMLGDKRALPELEWVAREDRGETPWGSVAEAAREAAERIRGGLSADR